MKKIVIVIVLLIILGGFAFGLLKLNKALEHKNTTPKITEQQSTKTTTGTVTLSNISNAQLLNLANSSMQNTAYTFKSVLSKNFANNQLNVILLGFMEQNGKYLTKRINISFQSLNGDIQIVPGSMQGTNITTESSINYSGSTNIASRENAITRVLQYLNSQGYNVNATDWAIDSFPNQAIDNYNGYLVHVYETFDGNPTSVGWYLVSTNGTLYNAGQNGAGPITSI